MPDSPVSNVVSATSPAQPIPAAPVLDPTVTWTELNAVLTVTLPTLDTLGNPLVDAIKTLTLVFGPSGSDLSVGTKVDVSGPFSGAFAKVSVAVPAWETAYDFEAKVTT